MDRIGKTYKNVRVGAVILVVSGKPWNAKDPGGSASYKAIVLQYACEPPVRHEIKIDDRKYHIDGFPVSSFDDDGWKEI